MKHREGTFKGVHQMEIYHQAWLPEGEAKAALLIVHGLAEHSGRYGNLVEHLVPKGYAIYGVDLPGHGRSAGVQVYVERFEDFIETTEAFRGLVEDWQPGVPLFLYTHSMGGLIGSFYLLDHHNGLAGTVFSAPAVAIPQHVTPLTVFLGRLMSNLVPRLGLMAVDAQGVSRDPAVVRAYDSDPLVYRGKATARLGAELLRAMKRVEAEMGAIRLPVLFLQGSEDILVDPAGTRMLYEGVSSTDKALKVYDGLYHEVHNEPEREQVLADVEAWLESRLAS